jgi:hypothetical protein
MIWLTWRLQRTELALLGLLLAGLTALLLVTHSDVVAISNGEASNGCSFVTFEPIGPCNLNTSRLYQAMQSGLPFLNFLPLIAAVLLALPIVAEIENGSYRLAWTQSITRRHWTSSKLGLLTLSGLAFAAIFALAFHWWSSPTDQLIGRLDSDDYDFRGTVPVAHILFAIGLMLAIGTVLKRPVPTIAITSVLYIAIRLPFMLWVRERLVSPETETLPINAPIQETENWQLDWFFQDAAGNKLSENQFFDLCVGPSTAAAGRAGTVEQCVAEHGLVQAVSFHPPSHYWPLQLIETAIFLGAAALLIGFAAWYMLRRIE